MMNRTDLRRVEAQARALALAELRRVTATVPCRSPNASPGNMDVVRHHNGFCLFS